MKPVPTPVVEERTVDELARETARLVKTYTGQQPTAGSPAGAMVQLFARMAEVVGERLNRAPDRNFLAFLDILGLDRLPPQPARAPVTFALAAGAPGDALVPAGTQVGALPLPGDTAPVVFETEADLVVTRTELGFAYTRDPRSDAAGERPRGILPPGAPAPALFEDGTAAAHTLYLSYPALAAQGAKRVTLDIVAADRSVPWPRYLRWSAYDGAQWRTLPGEWDGGRWRVAFPELPPVALAMVAGRAEAWLRAELTPPLRRSGLAPASLSAPPSPRWGDGSFYPFGETLPPQPLVIAVPEVPAGARVELAVAVVDKGTAQADTTLTWEYASAGAPGGWAALGTTSAAGTVGGGLADGTLALTRSGTLSFTAPGDWAGTGEGDARTFALRATVSAGGYAAPTPELPRLSSIAVGYDWRVPPLATVTARVEMHGGPQPPAAAFANGGPLDLTKDFYPFGERPRFGDTMYLSLPDLADKPGARATLLVALTNPGDGTANPGPAVPRDLLLRWEFWNARTGRWEVLGESGTASSIAPSPYAFADATVGFSAQPSAPEKAAVSFTRPPEMGETEVNGVRGAWIRVRIAAGGYGTDAVYEPVLDESGKPKLDANSNQPVYSLTPASYHPPSIKSLELSYDYVSTPAAPLSTLAENDFAVEDVSAVAAAQGTQAAAGSADGARASDDGSTSDGAAGDRTSSGAAATGDAENAGDSGPREPAAAAPGFVPFVAAEGDPALYLGFRRPGGGAFGDGAVTIYFSVEEPQYRPSGPTAAPAPPVVAWEHRVGAEWVPLHVQDETQAFTRRGTVTFVPPEMAPSTELGLTAHWIRARLAAGGYALPPRLRGVALNTTWAGQHETVLGEDLGSSNGERSQEFTLSRTPVLPGEAVEVREPAGLSATEMRTLQGEEGPDAVRRAAAPGGGEETWVRWHRVPDFLASDARSRHYVLDWSTGMVRFGDGVRGMVPPQGRGAVRAARYQAGGGTQGNRPAGNLAQLRSTVPYVDAVTNPEPAAGGSAAETMDALRVRGPRTLRHGGRAVALSDYEDLAMAASPEVAVARAVPPADRTAAGSVQLLVVPASAQPKPVPSVELLERVRGYVGGRTPPAVRLDVAGPRWLCVTVATSVVPSAPEAAHGLAEKVAAALTAFLHPLTGGNDGRGWDLGRRPYRSELYALVEAVPGVDHLRSLAVEMVEDGRDAPPPAHVRDRLLVYSGAHRVQVAQGD